MENVGNIRNSARSSDGIVDFKISYSGCIIITFHCHMNYCALFLWQVSQNSSVSISDRHWVRIDTYPVQFVISIVIDQKCNMDYSPGYVKLDIFIVIPWLPIVECMKFICKFNIISDILLEEKPYRIFQLKWFPIEYSTGFYRTFS